MLGGGLLAVAIGLALLGPSPTAVRAQEAGTPSLKVPRIDDFPLTGRGEAAAWSRVPWTVLNARGGAADAPLTRIKVAWSQTGLYLLTDSADRRLTASYEEDFSDLWKEDVFEAFLWPDERDTLYFEYEISPLDRELPILVPNFEGRFLGWRPWHYAGDRRVLHATSVTGGPKQSGAAIESWRAEIMIPFALLTPLRNVPPAKGARWRANFYRMDHDGGPTRYWTWSPVSGTFHEFRKFGTLEFE